MYSLIITIKSIQGLYINLEPLLLNHYATDVETSLSHGEGYLIPSLIWPPPAICVKSGLYRVCLFMSSHCEVNS